MFVCVFFSFVGRLNGHHVPLFHCVTTNKRQETYEMILNALLRIEPNLNPTDFTTDFEAAAINAVKKCFPLSEIHCCFFHLTSNVWKHVQACGLQSLYNNDADFALQIRLLTALAFLPVEYIAAAYDELMTTPFFGEQGMEEYAEHKEDIDELVKYFQDTYMYRIDRFGNRKDPLFPPRIWVVYDNVLLRK